MPSPFRRLALAGAFVLPFAALAACDKTPDMPEAMKPAEQEAPSPETAQQDIDAALKAKVEALNNGDVDGAVAIYAPDATIIMPGEPPLTDPTAIRAMYASMLGDDDVDMQITPYNTWVSVNADFAVTTSKITLDGMIGEKPVHSVTTNQAVWQRQADGLWKIVSESNTAQLPDETSSATTPPDATAGTDTAAAPVAETDKPAA